MFYIYSIINKNPKVFAHDGEKQKAKVTMAITVFSYSLDGAVRCPRVAQLPRALEEEGSSRGAAWPWAQISERLFCLLVWDPCPTSVTQRLMVSQSDQGLQDWGMQGATRGRGR